MPIEPSLKSHSRPSKWFVAGFVLLGIASFAGLAVMITKAIRMVLLGRGLETFRTTWLVQYDWIGFLVLVGGVVLALVFAAVIRLREHLQWRSFVKTISGRKDRA